MSNPVAIAKVALTRSMAKLASHVIYRPKGKNIRSRSVQNLLQYQKSKAVKK